MATKTRSVEIDIAKYTMTKTNGITTMKDLIYNRLCRIEWKKVPKPAIE